MRSCTASGRRRIARACPSAARAAEGAEAGDRRDDASRHYRPAAGLTIGEAQVVIADAEDVALGDLLSCDALAVVLDAVRRAHVDHEIDAVLVLDHRVLPRDVRILQREVARLLATADDEAVLRDAVLFALIDD